MRHGMVASHERGCRMKSICRGIRLGCGTQELDSAFVCWARPIGVTAWRVMIYACAMGQLRIAEVD